MNRQIEKKKHSLIVWVVKIFLLIICLLILIMLPLGIERMIADGMWGYRFVNTIFSDEQWFSFWGSYAGAIITVVVLFVTIRYNKWEMKKEIKNYELDIRFDEILKKLKEIHFYLNFQDSLGSQLNNVEILYSLKLLDKRYFELINQCEKQIGEMNREYIPLVKQIFYEYLLEAEKAPKTLVDIDIEDAKQAYLECTKHMLSIRHKYVQQESMAYDDIVRQIQESRILEKRKIFKLE